MISDAIAADKAGATPAMDAPQLEALVDDYLMNNPSILDRMTAKLTATKKAAARAEQAKLIAANYSAIYDDAGNVVLGNPRGDVTLVEMFDYNCGYCRGAVPDMASLIAEDPNLKIILKEFPILSDGSVDAAKVAILVNEDRKLDYWAFHQKLFSTRGAVDAGAALAAAEAVGGSRVTMMIDMNKKSVGDALQKSYELADALNVSGTPTYIIGDELIPGAIGLEALKTKIANVRACGSTICATPAG
jgi:protein-disulfide isomerase